LSHSVKNLFYAGYKNMINFGFIQIGNWDPTKRSSGGSM
jgi:hypothetical protein